MHNHKSKKKKHFEKKISSVKVKPNSCVSFYFFWFFLLAMVVEMICFSNFCRKSACKTAPPSGDLYLVLTKKHDILLKACTHLLVLNAIEKAL